MDIFTIYSHSETQVGGFNAENIFKNYLTEMNISTDTINTLNFNR